MGTKQPISTITYNTKKFLIDELNLLKSCYIISYYEFIEHEPDTDGKKTHIHLIVFPAKSINIEQFRDYFIEQDPENPDNPFRPQPFRTSNYGDWYWYSIHDKDYLRSKQLKRNKFYKDSDIYTCDFDYHNQLVEFNPLINYCKLSDMMIRDYVFSCVQEGLSLKQVLEGASIPLGKVNSVIYLYNAISPAYNNQLERVKPTLKQLTRTKFEQSINSIKHNILEDSGGVDDELF